VNVLSGTGFYEKVRELRLERSLSLRAMAAALQERGVNISHTGISRWEQQPSGDALHLPKRQTIAALANFFGVSPAWLLEDIYNPHSQIDSTTKRQKQMKELELLSDAEFEIVIGVKNQILADRDKATERASTKPADFFVK